jgi:hypothetical protein
LLSEAPVDWASICVQPQRPPKAVLGEEIHVPARPHTGRLERTRFSWVANALGPVFANYFQRRLEAACARQAISGIHAIAHAGDFAHARRVACKQQIPYFLSVHDDPEWTLSFLPDRDQLVREVGEAWRSADARFVISEQMGAECCSRYGDRPFAIVTDGLTTLASPRPARTGTLDIYFMGLFHVSYEPNLTALVAALDILERENPAIRPTITLRCGALRKHLVHNERRLRVLPFASEAEVQADLQKASLVYLPLPFTESDRPLARFSLSTKMITYLGSGVPILYHGPTDAAACVLLKRNKAAFAATSLDPAEIAMVLREAIDGSSERTGEQVRNALQLAREQFLLADQRERFWSPIMKALVRS